MKPHSLRHDPGCTAAARPVVDCEGCDEIFRDTPIAHADRTMTHITTRVICRLFGSTPQTGQITVSDPIMFLHAGQRRRLMYSLLLSWIAEYHNRPYTCRKFKMLHRFGLKCPPVSADNEVI